MNSKEDRGREIQGTGRCVQAANILGDGWFRKPIHVAETYLLRLVSWTFPHTTQLQSTRQGPVSPLGRPLLSAAVRVPVGEPPGGTALPLLLEPAPQWAAFPEDLGVRLCPLPTSNVKSVAREMEVTTSSCTSPTNGKAKRLILGFLGWRHFSLNSRLGEIT